MNIEQIITELTHEIAVRQDFLHAIHKYRAKPAGAEAPAARSKTGKARQATRPGGYHAKRIKPPRPLPDASQPPVALPMDKPDTLAGAMKRFIRKLGAFSAEELKNRLREDAAFAKLLDAAHPTTFISNLRYWTSKGYLELTDETYYVRNNEAFD